MHAYLQKLLGNETHTKLIICTAYNRKQNESFVSTNTRILGFSTSYFISSLYWVQYSEGNLSIPLFFHMAQLLVC